jgi:hypothetical protein
MRLPAVGVLVGAEQMDRDPRGDAEALVRELFPHARWAVLAGSVTTP